MPCVRDAVGSVGEPIAPEAWNWYWEHVGQKECAIVDTYWQTETGSIIMTYVSPLHRFPPLLTRGILPRSPLPGATKPKPGSCTFPFFGIDPVLLDSQTGEPVKETRDVEGVLAIRKPWPSMARTIYGDHARFLDTYLKPYKGYYFTGDGVGRDQDGYYWIKGRVDGELLMTCFLSVHLLNRHPTSQTF